MSENRYPNVALSPLEVASLGAAARPAVIKDTVQVALDRHDAMEAALKQDRDWYRGEYNREFLNAAKWKRRHGWACKFGTVAVVVILVLVAPDVWDLAVRIWRWI